MDNVENELMEMAKEWNCDTNQLLQSSIKQYAKQIQICDKVMDMILNEDTNLSASSTNKYSGTTTNTANPLIKELPKLNDSATKTSAAILKIITSVGTKPENKTESALEKFLSSFDDDEDELSEDEDGNEEE